MQNSQKPILRIVHNLARSGGTLLSKCLGSMNNIALLSEIHPDAQKAVSFNAIKQAQDWHDLDISVSWKETQFIDGIHLINEHCNTRGQQLVLRDWSHVDYFGFPVTTAPQNSSKLINLLASHFNIISVQLLRNPLDTWESFRRLNLVKTSEINISQFIDSYFHYLQNTLGNYQLCYEDFLKKPDKQLQKVCQVLKCDFDPDYKTNWFDYSQITGDQSNQSSMRKTPTIRPRPNKTFEQKLLDKFLNNGKYQEIIKLLPQYRVIEC